MAKRRKIILEDGRQFCGTAFGADSDRVCEIVFNTSMVGYQEILSDPSYTDQAVVMTYPLIGNYGMAGDDYESFQPGIAAMIVREYNDEPSNFRSAETLESVMRRFGIVGVSGVDTRMLTRSIRDHGSRKALITSSDMSAEEGMTLLRAAALPRDAVSRVSTREIWHAQSEQERFRVVLIDCGVKHNLIRELNGWDFGVQRPRRSNRRCGTDGDAKSADRKTADIRCLSGTPADLPGIWRIDI